MKPVPYVVCAFHTDDEIYNAEIARLRESLNHFELPYFIRTIPAGQRWKQVCRMKPAFIQEMLELYLPKDVLYLDADAAVLSHPTLFDDFAGDLGVYLRPPGELFASTIYVKNNDNGRGLVADWIRRVEADEKNDDQTMLQQTVNAMRGQVKVVGLPSTYAFKFAASPAEAVIGQYQASRKVRNKAAGGPI